jgi:hypothetical protein
MSPKLADLLESDSNYDVKDGKGKGERKNASDHVAGGLWKHRP